MQEIAKKVFISHYVHIKRTRSAVKPNARSLYIPLRSYKTDKNDSEYAKWLCLYIPLRSYKTDMEMSVLQSIISLYPTTFI